MQKMIIALILAGSVSLVAAEKSKVIESRETMKILSETSCEYTVFQKIHVADEPGKDLAKFSIFTNDYRKLKSAKARIYDKQGKQKKKYKKRQLKELETSSYGILASGDTYRRLDMSKDVPLPFTIEMEYTISIESLFFWPAWSPQRSIPVEKASLEVHTPEHFQYKSFSPAGIKPQVQTSTLSTWEQLELDSWPTEISMPSEVYDAHRVLFAAETFTMDGYQGSHHSWQSIGQFYEELSKDQYELNPADVSDLSFTADASLLDSIAQIYDYVQQTTRYVGIELGIHGWRPHSSQWVCDNKYGDCKDLATFFISLLNLHKIEAHPVLILTRSAGMVYPEFPSSRFNHAIACVPLMDDTLWVDCTVDDGRIDIIPDVDQGCNVLVVDGENSHLVQTPIQAPENNVYDFQAHIKLNSNGSATLSAKLQYEGHAAMRYRSYLQTRTLKKQREYLIYLFDESAPGLVLDTFSLRNINEKYKPLIINIKAQVPHLALQSGNRLFMKLGLPYGVEWSAEHPSRRTQPFLASIPGLSTKTISVEISDQLDCESLPKNVSLTTKFGSIEQSYLLEGQQLTYSWYKTNEQRFVNPDDYEAYYNFRLQAKQADNAPVVFKQR